MLQTILIFLGLALFGAIMYFIIVLTQSQRAIVVETLNGKNFMTTYWVMPKKDKQTGIVFWKQPLGKFKIPEPPSKVINIGKKGKKYVVLERLSEDEYIFMQYNAVSKEGKTKAGYHPFTAVQRQVVVDQFIKAEKMRASHWLKDNIVALSSIFAIVIIITMLMVFWGDLAAPVLESHKLAQDIQQQNMKILQQMGVENGGIAGIPESELINTIPTATEDQPNTADRLKGLID